MSQTSRKELKPSSEISSGFGIQWEAPAGSSLVPTTGYDGHAEFSVDPAELNHVLEHLVDLEVRSMVTSPPTLEELFLRHYDEDITGSDSGAIGEVVRAR
jgi:hypothetical protein